LFSKKRDYDLMCLGQNNFTAESSNKSELSELLSDVTPELLK
jgi:hypothetical protein